MKKNWPAPGRADANATSIVKDACWGKKDVAYLKKLLSALKNNAVNNRLPIPDANFVLSHFHLNKNESYKILKELEGLELIRYLPYHAIEIRCGRLI